MTNNSNPLLPIPHAIMAPNKSKQKSYESATAITSQCITPEKPHPESVVQNL
jgi:hypothetical protein